MAISQQDLRLLSDTITDAIIDGFNTINTAFYNTPSNNNNTPNARPGGLSGNSTYLTRQINSITGGAYGNTWLAKTRIRDLKFQQERMNNGGIGKGDSFAFAVNKINALLKGGLKIADSIQDIAVAVSRNQLQLTKNAFEYQQKLFQTHIQLSQTQTNVALKTFSTFTTKLATQAAYGMNKLAGEEAIARFEKTKSETIAGKEYKVAEQKRIYEKTENLSKSIGGVLHGIAATSIAIGAAIGGATAGISLAVGAAVAGVAELGVGVVNIIQKSKKLNYEQMEQANQFYEKEMSRFQDTMKLMDSAISDFDSTVEDIIEFVRKNDTSYKKIGAAIGMTGDAYSSYARNIAASVSEVFGTTAEQTQQMMQGYINTADRVNMLSSQNFNNIVATGKLFGMSESESASLYGQMNIFNASIDYAAESMGVMYKNITKMGLSTSKFSKDLVNNLKLAQKYNFKGGVDNMMKLTKWAQQTRFNLNSAASFADSIMNDSLSGALEKSAKLQVLGGSAAIYSDPLGMLYDAGADVGNMAQRMASMFNDITGTFNRKTGETEFNWYENRMLAARAQAMGMDVGEVKNMIRQNNKQGVINRTLRGFGLDEETRLAIGNRATYKKGKGFIVNTTDGEKTIQQVANMTDEERKRVLLPENEEDAIIDIAKNVRSIEEIEAAAKGTKYSEKQKQLFPDVVTLSEESIKSQNIILDMPTFLAEARASINSMINNSIEEAKSTKRFFENEKEYIIKYREFTTKNIQESKKLSDIVHTQINILNNYTMAQISSLISKESEANTERKEGKREKAKTALLNEVKKYPEFFEYLKLSGNYNTNEKGKVKEDLVNVTTAVNDAIIKGNTVIPINKRDNAVVYQEEGDIVKSIEGKNKNYDKLTINHVLDGHLYVSSNGSTLNLVELIKNNPAMGPQFIYALMKALGKPVYNTKFLG